jgi:hypothetical protein
MEVDLDADLKLSLRALNLPVGDASLESDEGVTGVEALGQGGALEDLAFLLADELGTQGAGSDPTDDTPEG